MNNKLIFGISILLSAVFGCFPSYTTSTLVSISYDKDKNVTDYINIPYGSVVIPGKWTKSNFNRSSHQQFFNNEDSVTFSIAMGPLNNYEFYKSEMSELQFIDEYYEWDSNYWIEKVKGKRSVIKRDTILNYLVWQLSNDSTVNGYFLFGAKKFVAYSVFISSNKWIETRKIELVEKVYLSSNKE